MTRLYSEYLFRTFETLEDSSLRKRTIIEKPEATPEEAVMEYLEINHEIKNRTARKLCGIHSENSMKTVF